MNRSRISHNKCLHVSCHFLLWFSILCASLKTHYDTYIFMYFFKNTFFRLYFCHSIYVLDGCRLKFNQQDEREIGSVGQTLQEIFVDKHYRHFVYIYMENAPFSSTKLSEKA